MDVHAANASRAKMARLRAGFETHAAAADQIGCSRTLVLGWEAGTIALKGSKYLLAAAQAYRVRPQWLATGDGPDGYPWSDAEMASVRDTPLIPAVADDLPKLVEALSNIQALMAQALAATIPTAARELVAALDSQLPQDLREIAYTQVLRSMILGQLGRNDMAALHASSQTTPAAPPAQRR